MNLAVMPMFHIAGSGWSMVGLSFGCQTVLLRDVDPARILEVIPEFGVTNAFIVPAVIQFLLMTPGVETTTSAAAGDRLRRVADHRHDARQRDGRVRLRVHPGLRTHRDHRRDHAARRHRPRSRGAARPAALVRQAVPVGRGPDRRPRTATTSRTGEVGELWTRSTQNMPGYWGNDDATASAIDDDGWLRTGDAGYRDADGFLFLHDRVKDMIVSGGENIYPAEVENVLPSTPTSPTSRSSACPTSVGAKRSRRSSCKARGSDVDGDELIAFAREHLAGYKLPKSVDFADVLPRNPSGKLLKREIRAPYWEGATRQIR